ncbi:MAG: TIR domain-containing protein, partial [Ruminococcaceae bacterium]|nr:TIR domain-containing protein [Oscillospiraceae bacterium]
CGYFIAFISPNYLDSENCKDELNYARDLNKKRLLVYLEDVALPAGMAMRMNRLQSIYKSRYANEADFYEKLYAAEGIKAFFTKKKNPVEMTKESDTVERILPLGEAFFLEGDCERIDEYASFYSFPPLSFLREGKSCDWEAYEREVQKKAQKLAEIFETHGIQVMMDTVTRGPRITRYEVIPDSKVRLERLEKLADEIAFWLNVPSVRMEVPILGKRAVGIEVPNKNVSPVRLREMLDTDVFRSARGKTTVCLGAEVGGEPVYAELAEMSNLLVAGTSGADKSACIHSILVSLLYKALPIEVKLLLIDFANTEFAPYANIPHLLAPIATDAQRAVGVLDWAVREMNRRYDVVLAAEVSNITAYNDTVASHPERRRLTEIVVVINELYDLMAQAREAAEQSITALATKAHAVGIYLILGTQRPTANTITGIIKANFLSRICLAVSSTLESHAVLGGGGAEKLLNDGDMMVVSPALKTIEPRRVQGAFLDDREIRRVTEYLRKNAYAEQSGANSVDELFYHALETAMECGQISTSLLQRRLGIGFGKAARLVDRMYEEGIVSAPKGAKPREVLISREEFLIKMGKK